MKESSAKSHLDNAIAPLPLEKLAMELKRINYSELNARQKENFNFQKVSSVLADFGFVTLRLTDDWQGADFIAQHIDGEQFLKVQLKGRLTFDRKYIGKDLYVAFHYKGEWYLYPHDELLDVVLKNTQTMTGTESWDSRGLYSFGTLSEQLRQLLDTYRVAGFDLRLPDDVAPASTQADR